MSTKAKKTAAGLTIGVILGILLGALTSARAGFPTFPQTSGGGSGAVSSVSGSNNLTCSPTTGAVICSGAAFATSASLATVATSGSASDLGTGTLPAGRMPALTGDCTTSAGAVATSCADATTSVHGMLTGADKTKINNMVGALISRTTVGVETNTLTVSGLNGDADGGYRLVINAIGGSDSSIGAGMIWTLNGGLGTMSYLGLQIDHLASVTVTGAGSTSLAVPAQAAATGNEWSVDCVMFVKSGTQRSIQCNWNAFDATANNNRGGYAVGRSSDATGTNVTSFTLASTGVKIFGVGTVVTVYRLAP